MRIENMTCREAAKFIRTHKGKIYADVVLFGGEDYVRIPVVKSDLAATLDRTPDEDGIDIFEDEGGDTVIGQTYRTY